jgi:hypothetical protein
MGASPTVTEDLFSSGTRSSGLLHRQLKIEIGKIYPLLMEKWSSELCYQGVESDMLFLSPYSLLFNQGFGPLCDHNEIQNPTMLGTILLTVQQNLINQEPSQLPLAPPSPHTQKAL